MHGYRKAWRFVCCGLEVVIQIACIISLSVIAHGMGQRSIYYVILLMMQCFFPGEAERLCKLLNKGVEWGAWVNQEPLLLTSRLRATPMTTARWHQRHQRQRQQQLQKQSRIEWDEGGGEQAKLFLQISCAPPPSSHSILLSLKSRGTCPALSQGKLQTSHSSRKSMSQSRPLPHLLLPAARRTWPPLWLPLPPLLLLPHLLNTAGRGSATSSHRVHFPVTSTPVPVPAPAPIRSRGGSKSSRSKRSSSSCRSSSRRSSSNRSSSIKDHGALTSPRTLPRARDPTRKSCRRQSQNCWCSDFGWERAAAWATAAAAAARAQGQQQEQQQGQQEQQEQPPLRVQQRQQQEQKQHQEQEQQQG